MRWIVPLEQDALSKTLAKQLSNTTDSFQTESPKRLLNRTGIAVRSYLCPGGAYAQRVCAARMEMGKIDIAQIGAARRG